MKLDVDTGLPKVPEGYRWVIDEFSPRYRKESYLVVKLEQYVWYTHQPEHKWWQFKPPAEARQKWECADSTLTCVDAGAVLEGAELVWRVHSRKLADKRMLELLVGTYPPNRLPVP